MKKQWQIYALQNASGVFYVGATCDLKRRIKEHRQTFLEEFSCVVLETCGPEWRDRECEWIGKYRGEGVALKNKTAGGNGGESFNEVSRAKLSAALRGRTKPPEQREKIAASQRGVKKNWSAEGVERVRSTQFKKGQAPTGGEGWRDPKNRGTVEQRSGAATKSRITFWSNVSPERRVEIARNVKAGQLARSPEERSQAARAGGFAMKGVPKSEEHKAKIAAGHRARAARKLAEAGAGLANPETPLCRGLAGERPPATA